MAHHEAELALLDLQVHLPQDRLGGPVVLDGDLVEGTVGAPQWVAAAGFTSGTATKLALTVDDGTGTLKVCNVAFTPTGTTTDLGTVLAAASTASTPAGCVTSVVPASGTGAITSINGKANTGSATWKVSTDGSAFAGATRNKVIGVGDTIALRFS